MSNYPTSTAHKRSQKAGKSASSPLPGQQDFLNLNMPAPGEPKAVQREYKTEEELCEDTACPVPHTDTPRCSNDCKMFERDHKIDEDTQCVEKTTCFCKGVTCKVTGASTRKQIGIVTIKRRGF